MWASWTHLLVVHVPVVLTPVALWLLVRAVRSVSEYDFKIAYGMVLIVAVFSVLAYVTGPMAADWLNEEIALEAARSEDHALFGRAAFTVTSLAGAAALVALLSYLQEEEPQRWLPWTVAGFLVIALVLLIWTAHLGGLIRRPELTL
jgi:hypothetical protein